MMLAGDEQDLPLLLRMAQDQPQLPFVSALRAFQRRVLYANTLNDVLCPYATSALVPFNLAGRSRTTQLRQHELA